MKQVVVVFFLLTSFIVKSQTNIISSSDFNNIKINNITLGDLKKNAWKTS